MDNNSKKDSQVDISDELIAAFLDGNVSGEEIEAVACALSDDAVLTELMALSPVIDKEVEQNHLRILPMNALAAANPDNLCSFECEAFILQHLDFDIEHWSLLEEAKANNWVREEGTPLHHVGRLLELKGMHVVRKYDTSIKELGENVDSGKQVIAIIDKNIVDGKEDKQQPLYHAIYVTWVEDENVEYLDLKTLRDVFIDKDVFSKAWKASGNYMVAATLDANGYNPQPINVEDIDLDADLEELTEAIAENAHDIWARTRMDEGWTYGPIRNDLLKQHPDLVPYAKLPDTEKEYDRLMAMNTLRLVRRLGFNITNRK